ncbi:MAG: UbiA family prenyltransferase [Minisyncoccia bacterium]
MEKLRAYARSIPLTFESWIISLVGIVLIRTFLEQFSSFRLKSFALIDIPTIVHYSVFYLGSTLILMIILLFFGKTSLKEVSAVCIFGLFIICLAPIIDLVSGGIGGHIITYLIIPGKELVFRFFTFFGGHTAYGITLGVQIETVLGIIFCYLFVYLNTKKISRAIAAAVVFYCFIFFLVSMPSFVALLSASQNNPTDTILQLISSSHIIQNNLYPSFTAPNLGLFDLGFNKIMLGINTIIAMLAVALLFFLAERKKFVALIKNSRPERIFHFFLLFLLGTVFATSAWSINWVDLQCYFLAFLSFVFAWLFSVCQNDIYDETIDSVSNKNRPIVAKELSKNDLSFASKIFLLFAFLCAYSSSHYVLFFVCFFLLVYFIYSNPPLRLKRFVILNSFLVSLACLSVILAGFFLVNQDPSVLAFSPSLVLAIIIFFTAVANIRDIKDVEGDRADGIKTLPTILGIKKAKKIIAGIICFFFLLIPWYFNFSYLYIPAIVASIFSWHFINQENYKEWKAFVVYMIYLLLIIGAIFAK